MAISCPAGQKAHLARSDLERTVSFWYILTHSLCWALLRSVWGKSGQGLHGHGQAPDLLLSSVTLNAPVSSSDNRDSSRSVLFKYIQIISLLPGSWRHCQNILKLWSMSSIFFLLRIFEKKKKILYLLKIWTLLSQNHIIGLERTSGDPAVQSSC